MIDPDCVLTVQNFDEFLTILGDKVRLKGFDKYKVNNWPFKHNCLQLKGTVSRDFLALVFFLNLFILVLLEMP